MENQKKLYFTIPSKLRRRLPRPARSAATNEDPSTPAPRFVTEFDPSETQTSAATAPAAIAPLPNSHRFFRRDPDSDDLTFVPDDSASTAAGSSNIVYGLNLPPRPHAATENESKKPPPQSPQATTNSAQSSSSDLMRLRFKQDIATLPDHRGAEEYRMFSAEEFAAGILASYGWSKGEGIGRNNKKKGDTKVSCGGHRPGTQRHMLGYNPSGDSIICEKATEIGATKKRMRDNRGDSFDRRDSSTRQRRSAMQGGSGRGP